jgi:broad specificity phosphatase PhoE
MRDPEGRTLAERVAYLEGVMREREMVYPTAVEEWEINPLDHPERTLEERITALERRVDAWSRRHERSSGGNVGAVVSRG